MTTKLSDLVTRKFLSVIPANGHDHQATTKDESHSNRIVIPRILLTGIQKKGWVAGAKERLGGWVAGAKERSDVPQLQNRAENKPTHSSPTTCGNKLRGYDAQGLSYKQPWSFCHNEG